MKEKVLVTGADGFIGSHLVEHLLDCGYQVRALVLYNSFGRNGWLDNLSKNHLNQVEIINGDIRDSHQVREVVKGMDGVFHLAALISIPYSYIGPDQYVETNIKGTLNLLQAARNENLSRVIITSSSEVYGTAQYVPIDEKHPLQGQSPYSASKIGADKMAEAFYRSYGLPVTIARPFNTYGPRQSNRAIIPAIITQLLNHITQIKLGNLIPTRDLVYASDTVKAFELLYASSKAIGEEVNIATGVEISMGELAQTLIELINPKARVITDLERKRPEKSEVMRLLGSNEKLKSITGWTPEFDLKTGLKETIDWFSDEINLSGYKSEEYHV